MSKFKTGQEVRCGRTDLIGTVVESYVQGGPLTPVLYEGPAKLTIFFEGGSLNIFVPEGETEVVYESTNGLEPVE